MLHPPPISTPFPYTTLFRSGLINRHHERYGTPRRQPFPLTNNVVFDLFERLFINERLVQLVTLNHASSKLIDLKQVDRKSTRLNSSHGYISYAVFCLKKKKK